VLWDWLFGTLNPERDLYPETGLDDATYPLETSARPGALIRQTLGLYLYPFRAILREHPVFLRLARTRS
jgi:hypothetical protein